MTAKYQLHYHKLNLNSFQPIFCFESNFNQNHFVKIVITFLQIVIHGCLNLLCQIK